MVYYRGFHCVRIRFSPAKKISSLAGIISALENIISRESVEHSSQSRRGSTIERVPVLYYFLYGD